MIKSLRKFLMRRQKDPALKDLERAVMDGELQLLKLQLSALLESRADRVLGIRKKAESSSLPTVSGGRPESNRRKF
jgi:hypothetical protein